MEPRTIDIDGPVHCLDYAGPADGPVFVCVHGLGGSHTNWLSLAPLLAERGRVLVLDLAGFGRTPLAGRSASIESNRTLLHRFIERVVGDPVVLVGNSMGGAISILEAAAHPESVAGLVLVDPALPRARGQEVDRTVVGMFAAYLIPGVGEWVVQRGLRTLGAEQVSRETLKLCTVDPSRVDPAVVDAQLALTRERAESMPWATTALLQAARSLVRMLARRKWFLTQIKAVRAPTLLLMGRKDRLVPIVAGEAIARARPDWDFVIFEDIGHVPQLEHPRATMDAISHWLDGPHADVLRPEEASTKT